MITVRYIDELKLGNISDEDIPTFCYESGFCDLGNLELGLFKGTFLLRVRNTISSEHKHSIVFITDVSSNLHRAIIGIESKTWSGYEEKMQCGYHSHDPGDTLFDCLCSRSGTTYLRIICSTCLQDPTCRRVLLSATRHHGTRAMGHSTTATSLSRLSRCLRPSRTSHGSRRH